jgi:uncharacterized protein YjeT (DUF2065 family)
MNIDIGLLATALGLAFVLEGLPYFIWAEKMPAFLTLLASRPPRQLRFLGLAAILAGLGLIFLARG